VIRALRQDIPKLALSEKISQQWRKHTKYIGLTLFGLILSADISTSGADLSPSQYPVFENLKNNTVVDSSKGGFSVAIAPSPFDVLGLNNNFLSESAKILQYSGINSAEIMISPQFCSGNITYHNPNLCDNRSLLFVSQQPEYQRVFSMGLNRVYITAETFNGSNSWQFGTVDEKKYKEGCKQTYDEYKDFFDSLLNQYGDSDTEFVVVVPNEIDWLLLSSNTGKTNYNTEDLQNVRDTSPSSRSVKNAISYLSAIGKAKNDANLSHIGKQKIRLLVEVNNVVASMDQKKKSAIAEVIPSVARYLDGVGYSAYDSLNIDLQNNDMAFLKLTRTIQYIKNATQLPVYLTEVSIARPWWNENYESRRIKDYAYEYKIKRLLEVLKNTDLKGINWWELFSNEIDNDRWSIIDRRGMLVMPFFNAVNSVYKKSLY